MVMVMVMVMVLKGKPKQTPRNRSYMQAMPSVTRLAPVYYDGYETPGYYTGHVTTPTFSKIDGFWLVLRWLRSALCVLRSLRNRRHCTQA
jgi:hypothetical protein